MIDYFALSSGLLLLNPYMNVNANFESGLNFAVAGATILSSRELMARGFPPNLATNISLEVQLELIEAYLYRTLQTPKELEDRLRRSLFMVGVIGGNDFNYALLANKGLNDLYNLIPEVVQGIVGTGATRIVVPENFPIGCHPIYPSIFQTNDSREYDSNKCLKGLNDFAATYNEVLQDAIKQLRQEYPNILIVYGDYYNAFLSLYSDAKKIGLEETQRACCGSGGKYNFLVDKMCGMPGVTTVCPNPDNYLSWDGIHMT